MIWMYSDYRTIITSIPSDAHFLFSDELSSDKKAYVYWVWIQRRTPAQLSIMHPSGCSSAGRHTPSSAQADGLWPWIRASHFAMRGKKSLLGVDEQDRDRFDAAAFGRDKYDSAG